jgi:hypothetical protein
MHTHTRAHTHIYTYTRGYKQATSKFAIKADGDTLKTQTAAWFPRDRDRDRNRNRDRDRDRDRES